MKTCGKTLENRQEVSEKKKSGSGGPGGDAKVLNPGKKYTNSGQKTDEAQRGIYWKRNWGGKGYAYL